MKKKVLLFLAAVMLSFLAVSTGNGISARAASGEAVLSNSSFRIAIKKFTNFKEDKIVKKIKFLSTTDAKPSDTLPQAPAGQNLTAYYDLKTESMLIYSSYPKIYLDKYCDTLFGQNKLIEEIDFGNKIDTSRVESFDNTFSLLHRLKKIDLSRFDTKKVKSMRSMFWECYSLKSIDLGTFRTPNLENMTFMFADCVNINNINFNTFDTSKVTDFQGVFRDCRSLQRVDLSTMKIGKGTDVYTPFARCDNLKQLYAPKKLAEEITLPRALYRDDNQNGIPDSQTAYDKLPVSSVCHHYIFVEAPKTFDNADFSDGVTDKKPLDETPAKNSGTETKTDDAKKVADAAPKSFTATVNGITYNIDENSNATATKIEASGKISINEVSAGGKTYPVTTIAANAGKGNKKIKSLSIGNNVTLIDKAAFKNCKKLKKVKISANSSLSVKKDAFKKINKDASISIKDIKGKKKAKLAKAIKKYTNAKVK